MNNREIAAALNMIGTLLELLDDNSFRSNAYYTAARTIEGIEKDLQVSDLQGMPGVGPALREKISDMIQKGTSPYLDSLRAEIPPGLLEIIRIPNLGPKRVRTLWRELQITNLDELEKACAEDRLSKLKGFGQKLQEKVAKGLQWVKQFAHAFLLGEAVPISQELLRFLDSKFHVKQFVVVGSTRRGCELVRNLDILSMYPDSGQLQAALKSSGLVQDLRLEDGVLLGKLAAGLPLRIYRTSPDAFGGACVYWTGSRSHVDRLMERAKAQGLEFGPHGLGGIALPTEHELYKRLNLPYIEPELREDQGEFQGPLPELLNRSDLVGVLHAHTVWSDGIHKLEEMVSQAQSMGFRYIGISDHSRSAAYAGGLTLERLESQAQEIAQVQKRYPGIKILQGTECDILVDGSMDYPDDVLKRLDFVIASVHSQFQLSEADMTRRVIRALENPYVDILGHPTARLLLGRDGIKVDLVQVLDAAKRLGKVIELNANPHRLDLETKWVRAAREKGVMISINPDAHNRVALGDVDYGVMIARRGWVSRETVLNAQDPERALAYFRRNR